MRFISHSFNPKSFAFAEISIYCTILVDRSGAIILQKKKKLNFTLPNNLTSAQDNKLKIPSFATFNNGVLLTLLTV